jgi:hypothetical protein
MLCVYECLCANRWWLHDRLPSNTTISSPSSPRYMLAGLVPIMRCLYPRLTLVSYPRLPLVSPPRLPLVSPRSSYVCVAWVAWMGGLCRRLPQCPLPHTSNLHPNTLTLLPLALSPSLPPSIPPSLLSLSLSLSSLSLSL